MKTRTVFVNTKKEARVCAEIARKYGWERPESFFYKKYLVNLFTGYTTLDETRQMVAEIGAAILRMRAK